MTDTPFKVGETYKCSDGRHAVLIARDDDLRNPLLWKILSAGEWHQMSTPLSGKTENPNQIDILPPRRGVWVLVNAETGVPDYGYRSAASYKPECVPRGSEWRFFTEAEPQP